MSSQSRPVLSPATGKVVECANGRIVIEDGASRHTLTRLTTITVKKGQRVKESEQVGVTSTGRLGYRVERNA